MGLLWWLRGKESTCQCRRHRFDPWVRKTPWRRKWQPVLVFLPGKSHGQENLADYSPWGRERVLHSSVAQSCLTLCDPTDCSIPGFPVHHQLPELAQTHVHRVNDAIQPSHPLLSPSLLPSIFPSIRVFSSESVLRIRWPKYWSFSFTFSPSNEYSGLSSFRMDWLYLLADLN